MKVAALLPPALTSAALAGSTLAALALSVPAQAITVRPVTPQASPAVPRPGLAGPSTPAPTVPGPSNSAPSTPAPTTPAYNPASALAGQQTYLRDIGMTRAWTQRGRLAAPVTVAVLDTGYTRHPQLPGRMVNGYDFVSDPQRAGDGNGRDRDASGVGQFAFHGEMIAGIIGAEHTAQGMAGINPSARVVAVRVADQEGMIAANDLADGLRWAAGLPVPGVPRNENPARVINVSLFADWLPDRGCDPRIAAAVSDVTRAGALVVVGAGNENRDAGLLSPAGCPGVLTVTGVHGGQRPDYANWGPAVALAAPSGTPAQGLVASTALDARGFAAPLHPHRQNGTSFAAPQVSAAASLLLGQRPDLTPAQLRGALTATATPWRGRSCDPDPRRSCGAGTLNVGAALDWVSRLPPAVKAPAPLSSVPASLVPGQPRQ
ncbi:peptidase S8 and S53 subtilisin kexin sedolisin [Deinococcus proteolyticus MRP]|uniref:Peptidase S8 and S53 subtilisin kexin sedolisin n=1 Tax=Deinococcus proteolyticus (strain ATCC 35074 / DSM 20540 / JCM 6276 / NBRC 101906 / NCIMB 13154 / VKM Ac-1939 / CCM 2703 / MRP) TaxID=693977 RepID=F0RLU7_DEIPM|nr:MULTISPECIES: S8 family serine peptidase [Deinococcus]ADY25936.1 peptidase S8 and S53 subtilisin kexin sedolisin [Deinococcus proteolyticus MRP]MCY1702057.1 S8 family serine peptidase [Deinococcus sp. SL84]